MEVLGKIEHEVTFCSPRLGLFLAFATLSGRGRAVLPRHGDGCHLLSMCCMSGPLLNKCSTHRITFHPHSNLSR